MATGELTVSMNMLEGNRKLIACVSCAVIVAACATVMGATGKITGHEAMETVTEVAKFLAGLFGAGNILERLLNTGVFARKQTL